MFPPRIVSCLLFVSLSCAARADAPGVIPSLFDPAKHMRVAEVKAGMKGYGLSVFAGTKIERFDVEVISVLRNFNPKCDVVLVRCAGANLEHTGAIAGMSGSPVYLYDEQGRARLIGAFAYGWPLMKDPLGGVQPIEYMLELAASTTPGRAAQPQTKASGRVAGFMIDPQSRALKDSPSAQRFAASNLTALLGDDAVQLQPLATPLMVAGLSPKLLADVAPVFKAAGLVPLQAGAGGSGRATTQPAGVEPGSVLAVPLLTGDVELTAIGTCTEVIGERVFAFGHPFLNEGPVALPMGSGQINGIITSLAQSFKLGSMTQLRGTLTADQNVGMSGRLGAAPARIPIDLRVVYTDGSQDTSYHFECASHPRLTPLLSGVAIAASVTGRRDLPQYHTIEYDVALSFANGQTIDLKNAAVSAAAQSLLLQLAGPIATASENPFQCVMPIRISGTIQVTPEARQADILSVTLPKNLYRPGEMVKAFVAHRRFHGGRDVLPIELELPHDLRDGKYQLQVSDADVYLQQEQTARPFRFGAETIHDVFAVLNDIGSIRRDALYVRLLRQADGVAIGRTAMPLLPSSRRQVMLGAGRSNTTPFISAAVKVVPTPLLMSGSAEFEIEINTGERAAGGGHGVRPEPHVPAPAETKPKPGAKADAAPSPKTD